VRPSAFCLSLLLIAPVVLPAQNTRAAKPVSFSILEDYDKGQDLEDVARDFALFQELDIGTWRGSFGWDDYEPEAGRFDFEWLHRFAELAARHDLQLRPYLAYTPEWAESPGADEDAWNNAPRWLADWSRFAGGIATALRRHTNVVSFEIYNEENVRQWWDSTAARYADVMTAGSRAIREGNPGARVLFGGLVFPDAAWVEEVCSAPGARNFDVLPVHAYPETWTPPEVTVENYLDGLTGFAEGADVACGGRKPIWINETGFATVSGKTEIDQAAWWARAVATFLAHPRVEHIGVYEIKDVPSDKPAIGDAPNYHLGLTKVNRAKKLAFYTVDMLTDLLDAGTLVVADDRLRIESGSGVGAAYAHLFVRPDGARVLISWAKEAVTLRVTFADAGTVTEFALDGSPQPRGPSKVLFSRLELSAGMPRIFLIRD
jgi:hypothetical protein